MESLAFFHCHIRSPVARSMANAPKGFDCTSFLPLEKVPP